MSYITTFDLVFWVNILVAIAMNLFHVLAVKQLVHFVLDSRTTKSGRVALTSAMATYLFLSVGMLVWSLMTSLEGMVTATFWYTIVMVFAYKPLMRLNMRVLMSSAH